MWSSLRRVPSHAFVHHSFFHPVRYVSGAWVRPPLIPGSQSTPSPITHVLPTNQFNPSYGFTHINTNISAIGYGGPHRVSRVEGETRAHDVYNYLSHGGNIIEFPIAHITALSPSPNLSDHFAITPTDVCTAVDMYTMQNSSPRPLLLSSVATTDISPSQIRSEIDSHIHHQLVNAADPNITIDLLFVRDVDRMGENRWEQLKLTIQCMEEMVKEGKIKAYGVASRSWGLPSHHPAALSVERVLEIAKEVNPSHHLKAIRTSLNICEPTFFTNKVCAGGTMTTADYCRQQGLLIVADRPLETVDEDGEPVRLITYEKLPEKKKLVDRINYALHACMQLEEAYIELEKNAKFEVPSKKTVSWGKVLTVNQDYLYNTTRWESAYHLEIKPVLDDTLRRLNSMPIFSEWGYSYRQMCRELFECHELAINHTAAYVSEELVTWLNTYEPRLKSFETLQEKCIAIAMSLPVDFTLTDYTDEVISLLPRLPPTATPSIDSKYPTVTPLLTSSEALSLITACHQHFILDKQATKIGGTTKTQKR